MIWVYSISTALWNLCWTLTSFHDREIKHRCKSRQRRKTCTMYKHSASAIKRRAHGAALLLLTENHNPNLWQMDFRLSKTNMLLSQLWAIRDMDFKMLPHQCQQALHTILLCRSLYEALLGWMWMVLCHFELLPDMVRWVWAAGPLLNTHRVVAKPLLCCLGRGEPWLCLRLRALWARPSLKTLLNSPVLSLDSAQCRSRCYWKTPTEWELPPPCFTSGTASGRR